MRVWEKDKESEGKYLFRLDSLNGQEALLPLNNISDYQILWRAPESESIYLPYGYTMPLIPNYVEFIDSEENDTIQL